MELWTPNGSKRPKAAKPKAKPKAKAQKHAEEEPDDVIELIEDEQQPCSSTADGEIDTEAIHNDLQLAFSGEDSSQEVVKPKKKAVAPKPVPTFSLYHFKNDSTQYHMPYVPGSWTPQMMYRLPQDIILDAIRRNGSEGIGRAELGKIVGLDSTKKAGGRRVTNWINHCITEYGDYIGQFQKMEGKVRTIRYYWKQSEQPEQFQELFREFKEYSGGQDCPFKIGEVVKFPEKKLNTLRVSDVSLKRLNRILRLTNERRVIVTLNQLIKAITEEEAKEGYLYQIDKKSLMKCVLALKTKKLVNLWDTTVRSDAIDYQIQIIGHRDIDDVDSEEVTIAIQSILEDYQKTGRVFPHGQFRHLKPRPEYLLPKGEFDGDLTEIVEDLSKPVTIKDRFHFFRLQTIRNSYTKSVVKAENGDNGNTEIDADQSMDDPADVTNQQSQEEDSFMDVGDENDVLNSIDFKPSGVRPQIRKSGYYMERDSLGHQSKLIRLLLVHEMAFHFVHSESEGLVKNFEIFPPTQGYDSWPERDEMKAHIFINEESPYRYMPPQQNYAEHQRGWFMLNDFIAALPLSVLVMISHLPKKIDKNVLLSYLHDPIKRHLCVGYLPKDIRKILMTEKKMHKQIEHLFLLLGAMGLAAIGPNPSIKRFPGASSSMIFLSKKGVLYDTSTSQKGYSMVTLPIVNYKTYIYDFETRNDVVLYWHHLRAIVQSTPLSFRMEESESQNLNRHKTFSAGVFNKKLVEHSYDEHIQFIHPLEPHEGVAGFDSAMFLHLKRHWDLTPAPYKVVSWFLMRFRSDSDELRTIVEKRVENLQKDWNSFVRALMPTDLELSKNKKQMVSAEFPRNSPTKIKARVARRAAHPVKKKRKLDSVDMVSASSRVNVRCRFSSKERDQLIMIRAVGFFLNPVYRFWLDPTVLRDLMHEFVPESRTKTVQSLMACGVRELVRHNRLAYLQRVVRNLSTFPEMKKLRYELCVKPPVTTEAKTEFFKDAFRRAMRLLFVDNNRVPHTSITDKEFKRYLFDANVSVIKETSASNPLPYRSRKPTGLEHIQYCVVTNILLSVLIYSADGHFSESILNQISPTVIHSVLQSLRTDGLVARNRVVDPKLEVATKNHAALSYYFRHFFAHRFHPELVDGSGLIFEQIEDENGEEMVELLGDSPAVVVAATAAFYDPRFTLDMTVDEDILDAFTRAEEDQTTKKIRYLESANLHFEKIHIYLDKVGANEDHESSVNAVLKILDKSRLILSPEDVVPFDVWVQKFEPEKSRLFRLVLDVIKSSKAVGFNLAEIERHSGLMEGKIVGLLGELVEQQYVLECGVDETRWVLVEYESVWCVTIAGRRYCPRPWVMPAGGVCLSTVRWMAESVLLCIIGKFGITMKDLLFNYEFAIQPIIVRELIDVLVKAECVEVVKKGFKSNKLSSPFDDDSETVEVTYIHPTVKALEKFSRMFNGIPLLPTMVSQRHSDDKEKPLPV